VIYSRAGWRHSSAVVRPDLRRIGQGIADGCTAQLDRWDRIAHEQMVRDLDATRTTLEAQTNRRHRVTAEFICHCAEATSQRVNLVDSRRSEPQNSADFQTARARQVKRRPGTIAGEGPPPPEAVLGDLVGPNPSASLVAWATVNAAGARRME
jgi:hypothetical protein